MYKVLFAAALLAASFTASAGNSNSNPCGNNGNNCDSGSATATGGNATGGNAYAGAAAGAVAGAAASSGSSSSVGDVKAYGGAGGSSLSVSEGGKGGNAFSAGGDANQHQSNLGINGQSLDNVVKVNSGSKNDNKSAAEAKGNTTTTTNTTSVRAGDVNIHEAEIPDDVTIRQAAPVYLNTAAPSASCVITGGAGVSGIIGAITVNAGKVDEACRVYEAVRINQQADPEAAKRAMCTLEFWALANPKQCAGTPVLFEMSRKAKRAARK